jgi:hypothetical protein
MASLIHGADPSFKHRADVAHQGLWSMMGFQYAPLLTLKKYSTPASHCFSMHPSVVPLAIVLEKLGPSLITFFYGS